MVGMAPGGRVIVVGGGIIGVAIADHLAAMGHRDVVVLERGNLGEGTTSRATGGIRQQFTSEINARLARRSVELFEQLDSEAGDRFQFRQHGYLFLLSSPTQYTAYAEAIERQNSWGIPSRLVPPDELVRLSPELCVDGLLGGAYCATDGSAVPNDALGLWAARARRAGVSFLTQHKVTEFLLGSAGRVRGVRTPDSDMEADVVVLATGPWCADLGRQIGADFMVSPHRRQAFAVAPLPWIRGDLPFTVDLATGAYIHPEASGGAVVGGTDRDTPASTDSTVDWERSIALLDALVARWPAMADAQLIGGWAGLREMTPDDHAIVGRVAETDGLWVAAGFSGHGFMQAPAIGEAVAQLLMTGTSDIDISALSPSRFAEGDAIGENLIF